MAASAGVSALMFRVRCALSSTGDGSIQGSFVPITPRYPRAPGHGNRHHSQHKGGRCATDPFDARIHEAQYARDGVKLPARENGRSIAGRVEDRG